MVDVRSARKTAGAGAGGDAGNGTTALDGEPFAIEAEIVRLLEQGATTKDILQALGVRAAAVGTGRKALYRMILDKMQG